MKKTSLFKAFSLSVVIVSVVFAAARTFLLNKYIQNDSDVTDKHYYIQNNIWTVLFVCAISVLSVLAIVFIIRHISKKTKIFEALTGSSATDISTYPSAALFTSALTGFMLISTGLYFIYIYIAYSEMDASHLVLSIMLILSSFSFLRSSLIKSKSGSKPAVVFLKLIPAVTALYWLIIEFIDQNHYPTTSSAAFHILSLVFLMLFLVYDAKNAGNGVNPKTYFIFGSLAVIFLFVYAIPDLLLSCYWILKLDEFVLIDAVEIVLALYAFAKMYCASIPAEQPEEPDESLTEE